MSLATSSLVVALIALALVLGVVLLARLATRLGSAWLRPAHAPLWLAAGGLLALGWAVVLALVPAPAELLSRRLHVAADGPGARVTHLALALAALLVVGALARLAFAALRARRLERGPVPAWFLLAGVGPDGAPLRALRARVFPAALGLALVAAAASAFAPFALDTTTPAVMTAVLTAVALAFQPTPVETAPRADAAGPVEPAATAALDPLPAILQALGNPPLAERRAASAGPRDFRLRVAATLEAEAGLDVLVVAPMGSGKTEAALEVARALALDGEDVLWVGPDRARNDRARERFASAPEAVILPPLTALTPRELAAADALPGRQRPARVFVAEADRMSGAELVAIRHALVRLAPGAPLVVLADLPIGTEATIARLVLGRPAGARPPLVVTPRPHETMPTGAVERWLVDRLPDPLPTAPRAVFRVLDPGVAHRYLATRPRYPEPTREVLALDAHAARRRRFAPEVPRPLAPAALGEAARVSLHRALAAGVTDPARLVPAFGPALVARELDALAAARLAHAAPSTLSSSAPPTPPGDVLATAPETALAPVAPAVTPIRTTRVRVLGPERRTRHRFLGPAELELVEARVELAREISGDRAYGPDQRRAHTRTDLATELPPEVVDAHLVVLPTADPEVLHTLAHALRDLAPWLFRDARELLGVTYVTAAELGRAEGAIVVHDRSPGGPGAIADLAPTDWRTWLEAARALLADCDCARHCARCCESPTCTATPHNVGLDRPRALMVLDQLLAPLRQVA